MLPRSTEIQPCVASIRPSPSNHITFHDFLAEVTNKDLSKIGARRAPAKGVGRVRQQDGAHGPCLDSPMACLDSPVASPMAPHGLAHGLPQGTPRHTRGALPTMSSTQRSDEEHRRSHKLYKSNLPCCLKRLQYNTHNMAPQCCHPTCMNGGEHLSRAFGQLKPPKLVS